MRIFSSSAGLVCGALLAACTAVDQEADSGPALLRNPTVTLAGSTRFNADRFAGDWQTLRCIGVCAVTERYVIATDEVILRIADGMETAYRPSGPGALREIGSTDTLVVMWVDTGFRTAAIGDASGTWAAIIDRSIGAPDRTRAASQVLDFNGWDVNQLKGQRQ